MTSKPIPKRKAVKAQIYVDIWVKKVWTYHNERKLTFTKLCDAREWASKQGFDGIQIHIEDWRKS